VVTLTEPDWNRVKEVLQAVLAQPEGLRRQFARDTCRNDARLLAEVESLLAAHERAGNFAELPALHRLAEDKEGGALAEIRSLLAPGNRLGPYEILSLIGIGGMGEVYKAIDTRLQRIVAVKVMPRRTERPDLRERFEREARTIAGLLHPRICVLHDIGTEGSLEYLVMEYVEGETLATRIARGALPIRDVVRYALDVIDALVEIHRHGIVHRDVKPSNIMLTSEGAKLLDFGIAKWHLANLQTTDDTNEAPSLVMSSTFGTPQYMAPEQLQGGVVDARMDIFAFGAVLYEMVAGTKAFAGNSPLAVAQAILEHTPRPIVTSGSVALEALDRIVGRCLKKDPAERWTSADEIRAALLDVQRHDTKGRRPALKWTAASLALLLFTSAVMWLRPEWAEHLWNAPAPAGVSPPLVLGNVRPLTGDERVEVDPAFSPDGKNVAYTAGSTAAGQIVIKSIDGGAPVPMTGQARFEFQPRWSPDGKQLLYIGSGGVFVTNSSDGATRRVVSQTDYSETKSLIDMFKAITTAAWSPDGKRIAVAGNDDNLLFTLSLDDGRRRIVTKSPQHPLHSCSWSPNGKWIACTSGNWVTRAPGNLLGNAAPSTIVVVAADGGELRELTDRASANQSPVWAPNSDSLYFVSNRSGTFDIYSHAISPEGMPLGTPARVTTGLGAYSIALSNDGERLAYALYSARANVWSIPIPLTNTVDVSAAEQVTTGNQVVEAMRVSPDGKWLLYDSNLTGDYEIFRVPVSGGRSERLTIAPSDEFAPDLSKDGRYLTYFSWRTKSRDIFVQPLDGGPLEQVTNTPSQESYPVWAPDGRTLVFFDQADNQGAFRGLFFTRRDSAGRWETPQLLREGTWKGSWSPDGRFLAYARRGGVEVWSADSGQSRVVHTKANGLPGAQDVLVADDAKTIYFKAHDPDQLAQIWSVPVTGGAPRLLVHFKDPARRSNRPEFAAGAGRFYFTIEERRSNIWLADITAR
jgi:serine/threonine protein kinase/Tol biopolymer transport system component